nr:organic solute transporter subunit beta [Anolis sagrei ordinatus]
MKTFWTILCFMLYVNTDIGGPSVLVLAGSHHPDNEQGSPPDSMKDGMPPEVMQELLWFFRREDPSAWNYSILGLSALVLVIGMGLLVANIRANRARKVLFQDNEGYGTAQPAGTEMKQAFVLLKDDNNPEGLADSLLPKTQNAGEVSIHWKDGNVTALYEEKTDVDI